MAIIRTAAEIRNDKVYTALLREGDEAQTFKVIRFIERLGAYGTALDTLLGVRRRLSSPQPIFPNKIDIRLLLPEDKLFQPPGIEELTRSVMSVEDHPSLLVPPDICDHYARNSMCASFKEHCEIQLVRFYIENPNTVPVIAYLGISKLSCFLCSEFLNISKINLWRVHQSNFVCAADTARFTAGGCPAKPSATEVMQDRVGKSLSRVVIDIGTRLRQRLERYRTPLIPGGNSPGWSSDENWDRQGIHPPKKQTSDG